MREPENLADDMGADPMFARRADGTLITRSRTCECGRQFTQRLLSERFLTIVERESQRAIEMIKMQIPGFFVPVHCPKCERQDLGHQYRADEYKSRGRDHAA